MGFCLPLLLGGRTGLGVQFCCDVLDVLVMCSGKGDCLNLSAREVDDNADG